MNNITRILIERCAIIADEYAKIGDEEYNPDTAATARIIAMRIRNLLNKDETENESSK